MKKLLFLPVIMLLGTSAYSFQGNAQDVTETVKAFEKMASEIRDWKAGSLEREKRDIENKAREKIRKQGTNHQFSTEQQIIFFGHKITHKTFRIITLPAILPIPGKSSHIEEFTIAFDLSIWDTERLIEVTQTADGKYYNVNARLYPSSPIHAADYADITQDALNASKVKAINVGVTVFSHELKDSAPRTSIMAIKNSSEKDIPKRTCSNGSRAEFVWLNSSDEKEPENYVSASSHMNSWKITSTPNMLKDNISPSNDSSVLILVEFCDEETYKVYKTSLNKGQEAPSSAP